MIEMLIYLSVRIRCMHPEHRQTGCEGLRDGHGVATSVKQWRVLVPLHGDGHHDAGGLLGTALVSRQHPQLSHDMSGDVIITKVIIKNVL